MTRKKVKLAFIVNDAARKATYKKRKKGLLKKVDELSTLCGIEACAIVYSPYDPEAVVWPSPLGVQRVLSRFRNMSEMEQGKKMMDQETFLKERILKAKEHVRKQKKDNREKEMALLMFQCLDVGELVQKNMNISDLNDFVWLIDQNMKNVGRRLETLDENAQTHVIAPSQVQMVPPALAIAKNEEMTMEDHFHGYGLHMNADTLQRQWYTNVVNSNGDQTMPLGDANLQNGFWVNPLP
ncbi:hypothetical protein SESBI_12691 [Sesbania bispinosa]|nr:hypothetical protein SESBI_12691 [Sesbania bispinosa]